MRGDTARCDPVDGQLDLEQSRLHCAGCPSLKRSVESDPPGPLSHFRTAEIGQRRQHWLYAMSRPRETRPSELRFSSGTNRNQIAEGKAGKRLKTWWPGTATHCIRQTVPIENSELNENMEFAHPPSSLPSGAERTSLGDRRHGDHLQISDRPSGGEPRSSAPTRRAPSLGEAI